MLIKTINGPKREKEHTLKPKPGVLSPNLIVNLFPQLLKPDPNVLVSIVIKKCRLTIFDIISLIIKNALKFNN